MSSQDAHYFMLEAPSGNIEVASFKLYDWAFSQFFHLELSILSIDLPFGLNDKVCFKWDDHRFHAVVNLFKRNFVIKQSEIHLISPIAAMLQGRHSRVYSQLNKEQLLTHFLEDCGLKKDIDFIILLEPEESLYFFHQDNETDKDFFCRLMAYWGLMFYEQPQASGTILKISDSLEKLPVAKEKSVLENSPSGMNLSDYHSHLATEKKLGRAKLKTAVYSPDNSSIQQQESLSEFYFCRGTVFLSGDLQKNSSQWLQGKSDEEISCLSFVSSDDSYTPGQPVNVVDQNYRVKSIMIEGQQEASRGSDDVGKQTRMHKERIQYHVSLSKSFYPVVNYSSEEAGLNSLKTAHIESGHGDFADICEQGNYLVRLLADQKHQQSKKGFQNPEATASLRQRNALYYAGSEYGLSFPLHKKTEVLSIGFNADEQQRGLIGALANQTAPSVVNAQNANQQLIKTYQGAELLFVSDAKRKSFSLNSADGVQQLKMLQGDGKQQISLSTKKGDFRIKALKNLNIQTFGHLLLRSKQAQYHWVTGNISLSTEQESLSIKADETISQNLQGNSSFYAQNQFWHSEGKLQISAEEKMTLDVADHVNFSAQKGNQKWSVKQGAMRIVVNKRLLFKVKDTFIAFSPSDIKISTQGRLTLNAKHIEGMG